MSGCGLAIVWHEPSSRCLALVWQRPLSQTNNFSFQKSGKYARLFPTLIKNFFVSLGKCQTSSQANKFFLRNFPEKLCRNFKFDSLVVGQVMELGHENIYVTLSCTKGQQRRVTTILDDGTAA